MSLGALRALTLAFLGLAFATPAGAGDSRLGVRVSPAPSSITAGAVWRVTVWVRRGGRPAAIAPPRIVVQSGSRRRVTLSKRAGRGVFRARVVFPKRRAVDVLGRGRWPPPRARRHERGRPPATPPAAVRPRGRARRDDFCRGRRAPSHRARRPGDRRITTHAAGVDEPTGLALDAAGNLYASDFPQGRVLKIDPRGSVSTVAQIPLRAEVAVDPTGSRLAVASLADAVYGVDLATGAVTTVVGAVSPHGVEYDAAGNLYFPDGPVVRRLDAGSGQVTTLAAVEAVKLRAVRGGSLYAVSGDPSGGRVIRIDPGGAATPVAGNNRLDPVGDGGPATAAGLLPSGVAVGPDGALLITQTQPVAAVRRVDLVSGLITTLVRGVRTS